MACLIAPATAAIVTTVIKKRVPEKYHLDWLLLMLWGGTVMLIVDHVLNGEIVWYYPFFTAGFDAIYREVIAVGIPMTLAIFGIWGVMIFIYNTNKTGHKKMTIR